MEIEQKRSSIEEEKKMNVDVKQATEQMLRQSYEEVLEQITDEKFRTMVMAEALAGIKAKEEAKQ